MTFSEKLYELRTKHELSQKQLAKKIGVAQASINYWEKGERTPSIDAAKNISDFFGITLNELCGIEEPDNTESDFIKACQWLEDAGISIDPPDPDDGLQQYYLYSESEGALEISCKMDKIDIVHLVNDCVNDANKTRDDIAIKYIRRVLKSQK